MAFFPTKRIWRKKNATSFVGKNSTSPEPLLLEHPSHPPTPRQEMAAATWWQSLPTPWPSPPYRRPPLHAMYDRIAVSASSAVEWGVGRTLTPESCCTTSRRYARSCAAGKGAGNGWGPWCGGKCTSGRCARNAPRSAPMAVALGTYVRVAYTYESIGVFIHQGFSANVKML